MLRQARQSNRHRPRLIFVQGDVAPLHFTLVEKPWISGSKPVGFVQRSLILRVGPWPQPCFCHGSCMGTIDVFVYGTLKPGGTYHRQFCVPYLKKAEPAQVRGLLYDLPTLGYPAMTVGDRWVKGHLLTLDDGALSGLDYLEGYEPNGAEAFRADYDDSDESYIRQRTLVFDLAGQPLGEAWVYIICELPAEAVFLPDGNWILPVDV